MINKRPKARFPKAESVGQRDWGEEILLVLSHGKFTMKKLIIKKGFSGGLQYHRKKNECGYVLKGKLKIIYINKKGKLTHKILKKGDCFHFPPRSVHQEIAITNCEIIEASTPYFNDRVRMERKFGLSSKNGLRTTKVSQIKIL